MQRIFNRFIVPLILIIGGLVFIFLGFTSLKEVNSFAKVEAVVSRVDVEETVDEEGTITTNETVYVKYTVDGKEYDELLQFAKSGCKVGDKLTVLYNQKNPSYVSGATKTMAFVYLGAGALVAVIGLFILFRSLVFGR